MSRSRKPRRGRRIRREVYNYTKREQRERNQSKIITNLTRTGQVEGGVGGWVWDDHGGVQSLSTVGGGRKVGGAGRLSLVLTIATSCPCVCEPSHWQWWQLWWNCDEFRWSWPISALVAVSSAEIARSLSQSPARLLSLAFDPSRSSLTSPQWTEGEK